MGVNAVNEEIYLEFKKFGIEIPNISMDRGYWLIRTSAGEWYDEFSNHGFIGINWNELTRENCKSDQRTEAEAIISKNYPESKQPGKIIKNIIKFYEEIKKDDVVMIPDVNSKKINFGIVVEDDVYETPVPKEKIDKGYCPYRKRRKVKWIKEVSRNSFNLKLFRMMQSHNTISNANEYADEIDSILNDFYLKGDLIHYKIKVAKEKDLNYKALRDLVNIPWVLADYIDTDYDLNELTTTISVQSPGDQKLTGKGKKSVTFFIGMITLLSSATVAIVGGEVNIKAIGYSFKSDGVLKHSIKKNDSERDELNKQLEDIEKLKKENNIKAPNVTKYIVEEIETEETEEIIDENKKTKKIHKVKKTSKRTEKQSDEN